LIDIKIAKAAASDPDAQRWLGWPRVVPESDRERLLAMAPGRGRPHFRQPDGQWLLIAIDVSTEQLAGAIGGNVWLADIGGWLAPRFRSRGLGSEMFAAAALFSHYHLGLPSVMAGTEPANAACCAALLSAGFIPATGHGYHLLPDGRSVPASWFRHDSDHPTRCRG
jgi:RimJ/RimL family protein N-acetyltransferase